MADLGARRHALKTSGFSASGPSRRQSLESIVEAVRTRLRQLPAPLLLVLTTLFGSGIAHAQTPAAVRVVNGFYAWYLASHGNWTNLSGARAYLTPSLYASLEKLVGKERAEQAEMLDFDPFDGAQSEAASYAITTPSGSGTSVAVPVRIRLSGGNGSSTVRVIVVRDSSGWKIDNFVYPGNGNLRDSLRNALK